MSALNKQHGGSHYKHKGVQPVELWADLNLNAFQGAIIKYLTRHRQKNGAEDLDKAEHFFELMVELGVNCEPWWHYWRRVETLPVGVEDAVARYCLLNSLTKWEKGCILNALRVGDGKKYLVWFRYSLARVRSEAGYNV